MKTTIIFMALIISGLLFSAYSQVQQWASTYTGLFTTSQDHGKAIAIDIYGNAYITGYSDVGIATVQYLSSNGGQNWASRYEPGGSVGDNRGNSIAVYTDNSEQTYIYVTGRIHTTNQGYDYVTIKYNIAGSVVNGPVIYNGPGNGDDEANSIAIDVNGNVYVTGFSLGNGTNYDYATIKYSPALVRQWVVRYDGPESEDDFANVVKVDYGFNVYVTGYSRGTGEIFDFDIATIKYSTSGGVVWQSRYYSTSYFYEAPEDMEVDYYEGVYIVGQSNYDPSEETAAPLFTVIKYDPDEGEELWVDDDYEGIAKSLILYKVFCQGNQFCYDNEIFVTGQIDNGFRGFTLKFDEDGNEIGSIIYNVNYSGFNSICVDADENVYAAGFSGNNPLIVSYNSDLSLLLCSDTYEDEGTFFDIKADYFGTSYAAGETSNGTTLIDYLTVKYETCGNSSPFNANNHSNSQVNPNAPMVFSLNQNYPNPFNPVTNIKYEIPVNTHVNITVYDMLGKSVKTMVNVVKEPGYYSVTFDGSGLPTGVYFYRIEAGDFVQSKKMVFVK